MKFKIDENLPIEVAGLLGTSEHDTATVVSQGLGGTSDQKLIDHCKAEGRVLITFDRDFADIRAYPPGDYPGIIVLRLKRQDKNYILDVFGNLSDTIIREELEGKLWVVEENQIRIRG